MELGVFTNMYIVKDEGYGQVTGLLYPELTQDARVLSSEMSASRCQPQTSEIKGRL